MSAPVRIQLKRTKGWRMPENTVKVDRSTKWGNPFVVGQVRFFINDNDPNDRLVIQPTTVEEAVAAFRWLVEQPSRREAILKLRGKNLACWCKSGEPCHADVLLELANSGTTP
ncbi:MAG TPA: DUF4326 domain-containing protein [Mesorhizobium sp.]|jgi:hypothetical protein|nr:DUF4326 domain-containing protein [Mesorhizobium sp.]